MEAMERSLFTPDNIVILALSILYAIEVLLGFSTKITASNTWQLARDLTVGAYRNSLNAKSPELEKYILGERVLAEMPPVKPPKSDAIEAQPSQSDSQPPKPE